MHPFTCRACGHEFDAPAHDQAGPGCPRCGEPIDPGPTATPSADLDSVLSTALGVSLIGPLAAALLFISRS
jgi:hypothetical protein